MTHHTDDESRAPAARGDRRTGRAWRLATPVALGVCGVLVVTSAANSEGTDLRPGRYSDLASVVRAENREVSELQDRAGEIADEVEELGRAGGDRSAQRYRDDAAAAEGPAGMAPRSGEGITITMSDAPAEVFDTSDLDPNRLVVHQQDLQAVVNALWRGGAEAMTLQGQRIISTTGIKCAGSSVQLQGVAYPQPYVIEAVGVPEDLLASVYTDEFVSYFREDAEQPEIAVGFDVETADRLTTPAYDGLLGLTYAEPMR